MLKQNSVSIPHVFIGIISKIFYLFIDTILLQLMSTITVKYQVQGSMSIAHKTYYMYFKQQHLLQYFGQALWYK